MSNTVDWAYLNSGFGSPMATPQQKFTYGASLVPPPNDVAPPVPTTPWPNTVTVGLTPSVAMANAVNAGQEIGVKAGHVTELKNATASLEASAKVTGDVQTAQQARATMQNITDLQNADMRRIRATTEINKADALAQLHDAYTAGIPDIGPSGLAEDGTAARTSATLNQLADAKSQLASAQVQHLTADRELQGKVAEYDVLRDRYAALMNDAGTLKKDIAQLQRAHDLPVVEHPTLEIPLVVKSMEEAHNKLQSAIGARPAAEQALDASESSLAAMQNSVSPAETIALQKTTLPAIDIVQNAMRGAVSNARHTATNV